MMTVLMWGARGAGVAIVYAFASFCLLTPLLRNDPVSLLHYGLQGFILGGVYAGLRKTVRRFVTPQRYPVLIDGICGGIGGLVSSSYSSLLTYYSAIASVHWRGAEVLPEVRAGILLTLINYTLGSSLIGLLIGVLVGNWQKRR
jgi:hypothetical protein